jgi:hypothetical protein
MNPGRGSKLIGPGAKFWYFEARANSIYLSLVCPVSVACIGDHINFARCHRRGKAALGPSIQRKSTGSRDRRLRWERKMLAQEARIASANALYVSDLLL